MRLSVAALALLLTTAAAAQPPAPSEGFRGRGPRGAVFLSPMGEPFRSEDPAHDVVGDWFAAADRDPAVFPEPDRFDIERRPNDHLAFGGGPHFCLGAHLARLEGEIAIASLVTRFADLRLVSETVEWGASLFRVPGKLPITFRAH